MGSHFLSVTNLTRWLVWNLEIVPSEEQNSSPPPPFFLYVLETHSFALHQTRKSTWQEGAARLWPNFNIRRCIAYDNEKQWKNDVWVTALKLFSFQKVLFRFFVACIKGLNLVLPLFFVSVCFGSKHDSDLISPKWLGGFLKNPYSLLSEPILLNFRLDNKLFPIFLSNKQSCILSNCREVWLILTCEFYLLFWILQQEVCVEGVPQYSQSI